MPQKIGETAAQFAARQQRNLTARQSGTDPNKPFDPRIVAKLQGSLGVPSPVNPSNLPKGTPVFSTSNTGDQVFLSPSAGAQSQPFTPPAPQALGAPATGFTQLGTGPSTGFTQLGTGPTQSPEALSIATQGRLGTRPTIDLATGPSADPRVRAFVDTFGPSAGASTAGGSGTPGTNIATELDLSGLTVNENINTFPGFNNTPALDLTPNFGAANPGTAFNFDSLQSLFDGGGGNAFKSAIDALPGGGFDPSQINTLVAQAGGANVGLAEDVESTLGRFIDVDATGRSSALDAQQKLFDISVRPIVEGQAALQGFSSSPALFDALGRSAATFFAPLAQQDLQNQLEAAGLLQGQQGVNLQGIQTGLEGAIQAGQLGLSQQQLDISEALGLGELSLADRSQTFEEARAGAEQRLNEEIERGNLIIGQEGLRLNGLTAREELAQSAAAQQSEVAHRLADRKLAAAEASAQLILGFNRDVSVPLFEIETKNALRTIELQLELGRDLFEIEDTIRAQTAALLGLDLPSGATLGQITNES